MCTYIQQIDINWREMSHQRRRVLEYPPSKSPQAKSWYNSEIKSEQIVKVTMCCGWSSKRGAACCEKKGWWIPRPRLWVSLIWWTGKSPETNQHNSTSLDNPQFNKSGGCSSVEQLLPGTWKKQCWTGDEWKWLKL